MENQTNIFKTSDIKISAFLLCKDIPLLELDKENIRKIFFCFQNSNEVAKLLNVYWSDQATVNPRLLFEKLDYLKDLIHGNYEI